MSDEGFARAAQGRGASLRCVESSMKHACIYQKNLSLIKDRLPRVGTKLELAQLPESD